MKNCDHGLPINEHCDVCSLLLSAKKDNEVLELRQQLAESESLVTYLRKQLKAAEEWQADHEGKLEALTAQLAQYQQAEPVGYLYEIDKKDSFDYEFYMSQHDTMLDHGYKEIPLYATCQLQETPQPAAVAVTGLHPATADLVLRFSKALAEKLAAAEKKYGYSDGWLDGSWLDECRAKLVEHVAKGDPRDVAAYCAFLWHHGSHTAAAPAAVAVVLPEENTCAYLHQDYGNGWNACIAEVRRLNAEVTTVQELARLRGLIPLLQEARDQLTISADIASMDDEEGASYIRDICDLVDAAIASQSQGE